MPAPPRRPAGNGLQREPSYARAYVDHTDEIATARPGTPIPFVGSTPGVKRDGLNLRANGWLLNNYRNSGGPVLWVHDHVRPPIGRADATVESDRLRMPVVFDHEDPFAAQIESKVRRKFLRACSVGWDFVDRDGGLLDHWRMSPDYLSREAFYDLTELSIVPVGADPAAIAERSRRALGHLGRELVELYDAQERPDSNATEPEVRAAVIAECRRLGIALAADGPPRTDPRSVRGSRLVRSDDLPELLRGLGVPVAAGKPATPYDPALAGKTRSPALAGVDTQAARSLLLAAFPTLKGAS